MGSKYRHSVIAGRGMALCCALFALLAGFAGCGFNLKDLAQDYVQVSVGHEVVSESENNTPLLTCTIQATITNNYAVDLVNAKTTLTLASGIELQAGKLENTNLSISTGDTVDYSWTVKIPVTTEDRNLEYSVAVSSEVSSAVSAHDLIFVKGINEDDNRFDFTRDTWSFENFGAKPVPLNQDDYNAFMYALPNNQQAGFKDYIQQNSTGGLCYGMAATSILVKMDRFPIQDMGADDKANNLHDLKKNDEAKSAIGYYWITQNLPEVRENRLAFNQDTVTDKLATVANYAERVQTGGVPFILSFNTTATGGGHAVVAYGVEHGIYERENGVTYNSRILIYDNNYPKFDEKSCLYFNTGTDQWYIPNYPDSSDITRALNDINLMDTMNIAMNSESSHSYIRAKENMNLVIYQPDGAAPIEIDMLRVSNPDMASAYFDDGAGDEVLNIALRKPADGAETSYQIEAREQGAPLDLTITYNDFYMSANAETAKSIQFAPAGTVGIDGETTNFRMTLTGNQGHHALSWHTLEISGNSAVDPKLESGVDGYLLTGDNLNGVTVFARGGSDASELRLKTGNQKIWISSDGTNLTAGVDNDSDGEFETIIATGYRANPDAPNPGGGEWWRIPLYIAGGLATVGGAILAFLKIKSAGGAGRRKRTKDDDEFKW